MKVLNEVHVPELDESTKTGEKIAPPAGSTSKLVQPRESGEGTSSCADINLEKTTTVVVVVSDISLVYLMLL